MNASPVLNLLISPEQIQQKLLDFSQLLNQDYQGKEVMILMVMKGSFCFVADLIRCLSFPVTIECVFASSYGKRGTERGELTVSGLEQISLKNKHVLIIDDIFHTGHTLHYIVHEVKKREPLTLESAVLLLKEYPRTHDYLPDYFLFKIGNPFVVGYGLDFKEYHRELPGIYTLGTFT